MVEFKTRGKTISDTQFPNIFVDGICFYFILPIIFCFIQLKPRVYIYKITWIGYEVGAVQFHEYNQVEQLGSFIQVSEIPCTRLRNVSAFTHSCTERWIKFYACVQ